jgi:hypothetical protein
MADESEEVDHTNERDEQALNFIQVWYLMNNLL